MSELKKEQEKKQEKKTYLDEPYKLTTLRELGNRFPVLPFGADQQPVKDRTFTFLPWDMDTEEKIAEVMADPEDLGTPICKMMCHVVDTLCGEEFAKFPEQQKINRINSLEFSNVMYMYMYLRTEELGTDLKLDIACPNCKKMMKGFTADLNTLEVHQKNDDHKRNYDYELVKPVTLDGNVITNVVLEHSKWYSMGAADIETAQNHGKMKKLMLDAAIQKVYCHKDKSKPIDKRTFLKKMKKIDIEKISEVITDNDAGPLLSVKGKCNKCKRDFYRALDWSYHFFFDSSSL